MHDPELDRDEGKGDASSAEGRQAWLRRAYAALVLAVVLPFLVPMLVIAIKPLRYAERLERPLAVRGVTPRALVLEDGTLLRIPGIKRIPVDDPVLRGVLERGVERDGRGEVYGLLTAYSSCGMTAYRHFTYRVNLADVVGALDPSGLDDSRIPPEEIGHLGEQLYRPATPRRVNEFFLSSMRHVRQVREYHAAHPPGAGPS